MKIDAHQHFWQYNESDYGWIDSDMGVLKQDFLPPDLAALAEPLGIQGTVAVQARQTVAETEWLLHLASQYPLVKGVVGWVDLRSPDIAAHLERLSQDRALKGIRHVVQDEPDDEFMLGADFRRGVAALAEFGLTYDLLLFPRHLPVACRLVEAFPDQPFVLDHIAKPPVKEGMISPWAQGIRRLAAYPHVVCKISGLVTEADWQHWRPEDFHPYLDAVLEAFGPQRLMFGSDWPVCNLAGRYAQVVELIDDYLQQLSAAEQGAIWGATASHFYGLD